MGVRFLFLTVQRKMWNVAQKLYWLALTMQEQHFQQSWCTLEMVPTTAPWPRPSSRSNTVPNFQGMLTMTDPDLPVYMWETAIVSAGDDALPHADVLNYGSGFSCVVRPFSCCDFNVDHNWAAKGLEEYPCAYMNAYIWNQDAYDLTVQLIYCFNKEVVIHWGTVCVEWKL